MDEFFIRLKNKILTKDAAYAILFRFWGIISQAAKSQLLDMQDFGLEEAVRIVTSTPLMTIEELHQLCNRLLQKVQALNEGGLETKQLVEAIKSYISENIYYDLSRETIAEQLKYHPDHLSRVFKKATGETLINYIQNEKIKTAIYLFKETNLSVSQVADRLGYTNFSYFSQLFKQKTGYTVREYKRKYLNKTDGDNATDLLR